MLLFILTLMGIFLGALSWPLPHHVSGWLVGGIAGFALGQLILLRRRLAALERQLAELQDAAPLPADGARSTTGEETPPAQQGAQPNPLVDDFIFRPETPAAALTARDAARSGLSFLHWQRLPEWVSGGNLLVKIGVVILFFGVAFLLKLASEYGLMPIELRLAAVALGAIGLLFAGWRLRERRLRYALALQGGGVGVLYLTIFAALRLYELLPVTLAFSLLVLICALSAYLAVVQDSPSLAILGVSGGFLAPVLASTGSGSHVALFSYYALLNGGIIGIALYRSWRLLNLIGFFFTFGIGILWGAQYYRPAHFSTVEPFLLLFVVMFVAAAVLFAHRQPPQLRGYVDGALVFGTPIIAFALQAQLVGSSPHGLAWSALGFGLFYLSCAWLVFARLGRPARLLAEAFLAFGIIFGTLAVPLALDGRWTAAAWAAEGAGLVWIGVRQKRLPARAFGMLLLFGAGLIFLNDFSGPTAVIPILNGFFLGSCIISGAALLASFYLDRHRQGIQAWERAVAVALFAWGVLWWFGAGSLEVQRHAPPAFLQGGLLVFLAASSALCSFLAGRLCWPLLRWPALILLPLLIIVFAAGLPHLSHPFAQGGIFGWPLALLLLYRILLRHDDFRADLLQPAHAAALWLITALLSLESARQIDRLVDGAGVWPMIAWGLLPALVILLLSNWGMRLEWPMQRYRQTYLTLGLGPVALFAWLWALRANVVSSGEPWPLPYLPLLNPLDIAIGFVGLALWSWQAQLPFHKRIPGIERRNALTVLALSLFFWFNGMLVRTVHHWGKIPFDFTAMSRSILLQTSFSIAWSLIALGVMTFATQRGIRHLWITGVILLAVVVGKLFLIDLSGTGTIERIVSFVGVGLLILLIGWFAPAPPANRRNSP